MGEKAEAEAKAAGQPQEPKWRKELRRMVEEVVAEGGKAEKHVEKAQVGINECKEGENKV